MQTRAVFFKRGFTGLTVSKPGYPGTRVYDYVMQSGGRPVVTVGLQLVVTCDFREDASLRELLSYTAAGCYGSKLKQHELYKHMMLC